MELKDLQDQWLKEVNRVMPILREALLELKGLMFKSETLRLQMTEAEQLAFREANPTECLLLTTFIDDLVAFVNSD